MISTATHYEALRYTLLIEFSFCKKNYMLLIILLDYKKTFSKKNSNVAISTKLVDRGLNVWITFCIMQHEVYIFYWKSVSPSSWRSDRFGCQPKTYCIGITRFHVPKCSVNGKRQQFLTIVVDFSFNIGHKCFCELTNVPRKFVTLSSKNGRGTSWSKAQPNLRKMNQKLVFSLAVKKEVPFAFEERNSWWY